MQSVKITQINPSQFETQTYSPEDTTIISSFEITEKFDATTDYVEYHLYNNDQSLLYTPADSTTINYRIYDNKLTIDPQRDLETTKPNDGLYYAIYNYHTNLVFSSNTSKFYISEISNDRTEIRLDTNAITNEQLETGVTQVLDKITNTEYYYDFLVNLGSNRLLIANNILLDTSDPNNYTVLVKLYEPLPLDITQLTELWLVEQVAEPSAFVLDVTTTVETVDVGIRIKGPNFNLPTTDEVGNSSIATTYTTATDTNSKLGTGSLLYQLNSILQEKGISLNIDYSEYSNFVHFSSAQTRLENFYYKLTLLEEYQVSASVSSGTNTYISASNTVLENKINDIITNFDGYEYYLYYESSSTAWPKTTDTPPYRNAITSNGAAQTWLTNQLASASAYDELNKDALYYAIPSYLRDDPANSQLELFIEMLGQHFDTLWTYTKDITNKYNADNRLDHGISKDLVADALRDLGISIYQNNFSSQNLYSSLLGITPSGSLLNIPDTTTTLPASQGLEYITTYVLGSPTSSLVPLDDANKEIYKRIFHNVPYLLKKKGTTAGLRALINLYGIPDTVLRINEFGGKDKTNTNDWDNWQDTFNYAFTTLGRGFVSASWQTFTGGTPPKTVEFRFKTTGSYTNYSQSLLTFSGSTNYGIVLEYTGSGLTSGSYSGSIIDPYYEYGTLKWISGSNSASIYQPFFNGEWWSVGLTADGINHTLYAKQKGAYTGDNYIKYKGSASFANTNNLTVTPIPSSSYLGGSGSITLATKTYRAFSGSFQEFRFYNIAISQSVFDDYVVNPYSLESNNITGSISTLLFRAPLGSDLAIYTSSTILTSMHPSVTGSTISQSFTTNSSYRLSGSFTFNPNEEFIYQDQPNAGIKIPISDKVKIGSQIIPSGNTLSPYISIQQDLPISSSYTKDINYVEVGFSPQDEINDDIQEQLGFFNFGEYIGDPRQVSASNTSYTDLNSLRDYYFQKYTRNYNTFDYIRLIKYLDNSLFKMIKDFVPARAGLATGVIVKQHILERNRYRTPQAQWENDTYTGSVATLSTGYDTGSVIYTFTGGTGGSLPTLTTITGSGLDSTISQSWSETVLTPLGTASIVHDNLEEFYNGQFEGTVITVTTGSLIDSDCQQFLDVNTTEVQYKPILYLYNGNAAVTQSVFLSNNITPSAGEMLLYYISEQVEQGSPDFNTNLQQRSSQILSTQ